jgi:hypothetical protein
MKVRPVVGDVEADSHGPSLRPHLGTAIRPRGVGTPDVNWTVADDTASSPAATPTARPMRPGNTHS